MALLTTNSKYALGALQMPVAHNADVLCVRMTHALTAAPAANDTVWLGDIPPGHVPVDFILDSPDIDTNGVPTVTISVGVLNAAKTDLSTVWLAASTIGQAGGMARPTTNDCVRTAPSTSKISVGLKFPATTATFAAGTLGLTLFYRGSHGGQ